MRTVARIHTMARNRLRHLRAMAWGWRSRFQAMAQATSTPWLGGGANDSKPWRAPPPSHGLEVAQTILSHGSNTASLCVNPKKKWFYSVYAYNHTDPPHGSEPFAPPPRHGAEVAQTIPRHGASHLHAMARRWRKRFRAMARAISKPWLGGGANDSKPWRAPPPSHGLEVARATCAPCRK